MGGVNGSAAIGIQNMYKMYSMCDDCHMFGSSAPIGGKRPPVLLILNGVLDSFVNLPGYVLIYTRKMHVHKL